MNAKIFSQLMSKSRCLAKISERRSQPRGGFWFFLCLHLILGGKLDVERREDLFFLVFTDILSGNGNRKLRPPFFQIFGHAPATIISLRNCRLKVRFY